MPRMHLKPMPHGTTVVNFCKKHPKFLFLILGPFPLPLSLSPSPISISLHILPAPPSPPATPAGRGRTLRTAAYHVGRHRRRASPALAVDVARPLPHPALAATAAVLRSGTCGAAELPCGCTGEGWSKPRHGQNRAMAAAHLAFGSHQRARQALLFGWPGWRNKKGRGMRGRGG